MIEPFAGSNPADLVFKINIFLSNRIQTLRVRNRRFLPSFLHSFGAPLRSATGALTQRAIAPFGIHYKVMYRRAALVLKLLVPQRDGTYEVSLRYATIHYAARRK